MWSTVHFSCRIGWDHVKVTHLRTTILFFRNTNWLKIPAMCEWKKKQTEKEKKKHSHWPSTSFFLQNQPPTVPNYLYYNCFDFTAPKPAPNCSTTLYFDYYHLVVRERETVPTMTALNSIPHCLTVSTASWLPRQELPTEGPILYFLLVVFLFVWRGVCMLSVHPGPTWFWSAWCTSHFWGKKSDMLHIYVSVLSGTSFITLGVSYIPLIAPNVHEMPLPALQLRFKLLSSSPNSINLF